MIPILSEMACKKYKYMKNILVVGMGPGGLYFANTLLKEIQSLNLDYNIILIDKRAGFTRYQKFVLYTEAVHTFFVSSGLKEYGIHFREESRIRFELENVPVIQSALSPIAQKTLEFLTQLSSNRNVIAIKELQEYQLAILKLQNDGRCTILQNSEIQSLDMSAGHNVVNIKSTITLEVIDYVFDSVIVADGKDSNTLQQIGCLIVLPAYIELGPNYNNAYGCVLLETPKTFKFPYKECAINSLQDFGLSLALDPIKNSEPWKKTLAPLIYIHLDPINHTIYITGEIPEDFLKLDELTKISESNRWFLDILYKFYHYRFTSENIVDNWVFVQDPKIFAQSILVLPNGTKCFIIGDALLPANFLFGHGAHKAILDAHESVKALLEDTTVDGRNIVQRNITSYGEIFRELDACRWESWKCYAQKLEDYLGKQNPLEDIQVLPTLGESLTLEPFYDQQKI